MPIAPRNESAQPAATAGRPAKPRAPTRWLPLPLALTLGMLALVPELAWAAPWDSTATSLLGIFTGGLARTIAIIAVIACGIAAMVGKLSWDWAIKIILGIVLIFGATAIVDYFIAAAS